MMKYLNQHIIITGGSSGIGKALAKLLACQGANITLIARDRQKLEIAQQEIVAVTGGCISKKLRLLLADVGDRQSITEAIEQAIFKLGIPGTTNYLRRNSLSWLF